MQLTSKRSEVFIYGLSMSMLLVLIKWLEAHFIVFNYRLDFFIGSIAILFTILGIDAGGLTREWYLVLSREIFNPNYALFTAAADGATFQPNPLSMINMNHLDYFKFVGRVIGKSICDGQLMDAHFTR